MESTRVTIKALLVLFLASVVIITVFPQSANVAVNRENKTISVTADHLMTVEPDTAVLRFGCHTTSAKKEAAYQDNLRNAAEILRALHDAGIKDDQISTESLRLGRQEQNEAKYVKPDLLQFEVFQAWKVRVMSRDAQAIVDLVVKAGANDVSDPEWTVNDPVSLEAKAYGAALAKARQIADQMAAGLGAQLGDLVYATNVASGMRGMNSEVMMSVSASTVARAPELVLKVFPKKVERRAQVNAVFALK